MSYWTAMLGGQVRYVEIGNVSTRILEAGDSDAAQTILLLHGSGGHAENFVTNTVPLASAGHVLAPDLLGHGLNSRPDGVTYSFRGMIDHVLEMLEVLDITNACVVGLSLGGLVAAHVAHEAPDRVKKLVFICSGGITPDSPEDNTLPRLSDGVTALFDDPSADAVRSRFERMIQGPEFLSYEMVEIREYMLRLPGARETVIPVLRDYDDNRESYDANAKLLEAIEAHTLFCWGAHNEPGPAIANRAAELMQKAEVEIFENSGHWPQVEEEEHFNERMLAFLE
jgi:2-hydroxy-6-oxonona-2,4-dienedioate hydrolase